MIVKKVKTSLTVDKISYPVINYQLGLAVNTLPQISFVISMGDLMTGGGLLGKSTDVSKIQEGSEVVFEAVIGKQTIKFEGVVKQTSVQVSLSNVSNSSGSYSFIAQSKLAYLGGLSVIDRVFVGRGRTSGSKQEGYRDFVKDGGFSVTDSDSFMSEMNMGARKNNGIEGVIILSGSKSLPEVILQEIKLMYKSESEFDNPEVDGGARELDTKALEQLDELISNIVGGMPKGDVSNFDDRCNFIETLIKGLYQSWGSSNGLDILTNALHNIFFALMPHQDGSVKVKQMCPVYQTEDYIIPNNVILGINRADVFEMTPTAGVRLRIPETDCGSLANEKTGAYIQYPDSGAEGLYKYINTGHYAIWFSFSSAFQQVKEKTNGNANPRSISSKPDTPKKTEPKVPGASVEESDAKKKLHIEIAKAVYALQKWQNCSIVIRVAHTGTINTGDLVKVDLTKDSKALAAGIPQGIYFGFVQSVTFSGQAGNVVMNVIISHVRNEADNKKYGLKDYPMYEKPAT